MACFQAAVKPTLRPTRRFLPARFMVFTFTTFTPKTLSTARPISILFALDAFKNVGVALAAQVFGFVVNVGDAGYHVRSCRHLFHQGVQSFRTDRKV